MLRSGLLQLYDNTQLNSLTCDYQHLHVNDACSIMHGFENMLEQKKPQFWSFMLIALYETQTKWF